MQVVEHFKIHRPWGGDKTIENGKRYKVRQICVTAGPLCHSKNISIAQNIGLLFQGLSQLRTETILSN